MIEQKKKIIFVLPLILIVSLVIIYFISRNKTLPTSISLPNPKVVPSPTLTLPIPSPTPALDLTNIEGDLKNIQKDLNVVKNEDRRLIPPSFLLDLGI